jgi:hypothetical protein
MADPYAGLAVPVEAPPTADDPYAGLGTPVAPHELPHEQRNQLLQDKILGGASFQEARDYAVNELRLQPDERALRRATQRHDARVRSATPPPPPPPDTSFTHDLGVMGKGALHGFTDALSNATEGFTKFVVPGGDAVERVLGAAGIHPTDQVQQAISSLKGGDPQTPGQHYLMAGTRGVAGALPFAAGVAPVRAAATLVSGASSGASGEAARQAGFGQTGQFVASLIGGAAGGLGVNALDRTAPPPMTETPTAPPPTPRGPMASIARITGADRTVGARLVAQRLHDDGINPYDAGRVISEAQANGTPAVLADLGENTRALAGSVSRQAGPARTIAKGFTKERQMGQMDRVRDAINRDIGPTTDVLAEAERLDQQAQTAARPLYDRAYAAQPLQSPRLTALLETPAGKAALKRATTIAANEGHDPATMGVQMDAAGGPAVAGSLSTQTLDYVKRGLDDIIEEGRNDLTGKLKLNEVQRSVNTVKNQILTEMDRLNPDYAAARQAYAGPAALRSAMMDGKAALHKSASEINQRIKNMTPAEADQYGLGLRSAIADAMERSPDGANKVRSLIGNPQRRAVLQRVFGSKADLDRFVATMENEQAAFETHQAVNTGSPTAPRLAEDQANSDLNLVRGVGGDLAAVGGGHVGIGLRVLERGADLLRFGAGKAGQRAREDAASLLFSASPGEFRDALGKITLQSRRDLYRRQGLYPVMGATVSPLSVYGLPIGSSGNSAVDRYGRKP